MFQSSFHCILRCFHCIFKFGFSVFQFRLHFFQLRFVFFVACFVFHLQCFHCIFKFSFSVFQFRLHFFSCSLYSSLCVSFFSFHCIFPECFHFPGFNGSFSMFQFLQFPLYSPVVYFVALVIPIRLPFPNFNLRQSLPAAGIIEESESARGERGRVGQGRVGFRV